MSSNSNCRTARWSSGPRQGFTLIEVLAAIILIDVGLLALVAGSAVLVRQITAARARTAALRVASNRLELLGIGGCNGASGDTATSDGVHELWYAGVRANAVRELTDSVTFVAGGATHAIVLRTRLPC